MNKTRMGTIIANLCLEMVEAKLISDIGHNKIIRAYLDAITHKEEVAYKLDNLLKKGLPR